jgi:hypothetical protein
MEEPNLKLTKLSLETDRNIIGECFISHPDKNLTSELGNLFSIIEIYNINDIFVDGFMEAISDLKTEYYLPPFNPNKSPEKRFEEAVARANRRIFSAINQSVEEVDLRNISAIIGIAIDNKVFISATGRIKGLFFRKKKNEEILIADILSSSLGKKFKPEPEKIFANILSGELSSKDAMLFINEQWLSFFSQSELSKISLENNPENIIKTLNQSLQEKVIKNNFYCIAIKSDLLDEVTIHDQKQSVTALISEKKTKDDLSNETNNEPELKNNLNTEANRQPEIQQQNPTITAKENISSHRPQKSLEKLLETQIKTEKYLTPSIMPNWQKLLLMLFNFTKKALIWLILKIQELSLLIINSIKKLSKKYKNQSTSESTKNLEPKETTDQSEKPSEIKLNDKINLFLNNKVISFLNLRITQKIALICGFLLIFGFFQSIVIIGRSLDKTGAEYNYEIISKQIEEQLNKAEAQNIFNDEVGAMNAIAQARELLNEIPDKKSTDNIKNGLDDRIKTVAYNIQKTTYLENIEPLINLDENEEAKGDYAGLAKTNKIFWIYDNNQRHLIKLDTLTDNIDTQKSNLAIKKIASIDDKNLIILTSENEYYKFEITKNSFTKISKPSKEYFFLKPSSGKLPLIIPELNEKEIVMSFNENDYLLFLDSSNQRLVILDKNSNLRKQYHSPTLEKASSFIFNSKENKIWFLADGKIYQIDTDF